MKNKKIKFGIIFISAVLLTGCNANQQDGVSVLNQGEAISGNTEAETKPEVPEGAIADDSGNFVYTGKLQPVRDDENGYMQVPLGYSPFQEEGTEGLTQYADATGTQIFTLDYYENMSYEAAAESMRYYLESQENIEGLQGAVATVHGYPARQLYCHFTDADIFWVIWMIQDTANPENTYYLSIEFDSEHQDILACSSTFQTVDDHKKTENSP